MSVTERIEQKLHTYLNESDKKEVIRLRTYFHLKVFIPENEESLRDKYTAAIEQHNETVFSHIMGKRVDFDSGIDLFCPEETVVKDGGDDAVKINHKIKCSMLRVEPFFLNPPPTQPEKMNLFDAFPVGYYLYMRSSTGTKTPCRLANLTGIIDSGYRGDIIAAFDNRSTKSYTIGQYDRVVQICPPDLSYPIYVELVDTLEELGETKRGDGGFGSTGA